MTSPSSDLVVKLDSVSKHYGELKALEAINLDLPPGEVLGLFGHNGAGKSTLMKIILGVLEPCQGEVLTLGQSPRDKKAHHIRQKFGYLPENVSFYDHLSGRDILTYFAKLKGFKKNEAERLLESVGLQAAANRAVKTYSKGMRQRLGLAQALLGKPKLLLLDEPTVGLDPIATDYFYRTVDELRSDGCAVILCSHVLPGVEAHIDRAMILGGGKQLALGNLETLRQQSELPIEIKAHGLAANEIPSELMQYKNAVACAAGQQSLLVPTKDKMSALRTLSGNTSISDLEIKQPSLQEIYSHFIRKGEQ